MGERAPGCYNPGVHRTARLLIILLILTACVACDQAVKVVARQALAARPPIYALGGLLRLQYAENSGAFLSLGAGLPDGVRTFLLVLLVIVILIAALVFLWRNPNLRWLQWLGVALLIAGGLGNLIDRVVRGGMVVDFAVLRVGPLSTGIFNVADVFIMFGIGLIALSLWARPATSATAQE